MVLHFANLSLSCLRGQLEGLITDLLGLYIHVSMTRPPTASMKDCLLESQGAPMRPWSWLKHKLMDVIYCLAHVCALCVLFMCACVSRTLAPTGSWPHNPPPHLSPSHSHVMDHVGEGERGRRRPRWLSVLSAGCVTSLALVRSWLKVEGCWHTLRAWYARMCRVFSVCVHVCVSLCAPDCLCGPLLHTVCVCTRICACACMYV